jgi:YegS/Rv2252/BmrU family lipid kinase
LENLIESILEKEEVAHKWLAIVNPNAGGKKCEKDWPKIAKALKKNNIDFFAVLTEKRGHAISLTKEYVEMGYRKFISIGGDGTLNEVVNGVFKQTKVCTSDITIAVITVGTGNDWGRTFYIPSDYNKCASLIQKTDTFVQDAGMVSFSSEKGLTNRYFINMAGLGFDGLVAQKTNHDKDMGRANPLVYVKNIFVSLFSFKSVPTRIVVDDIEMNHKVFSMGIGIGQYNGGGMKQAPNAVPDDGLFELTIIKDMSKWSVIANVNRLYNGTIGKHKQVEQHKGRHITIEPKTPVLLETDGESLGQSPLTFVLIPKSLRVVINKEKFSKNQE